jgi:hypothetical protein
VKEEVVVKEEPIKLEAEAPKPAKTSTRKPAGAGNE